VTAIGLATNLVRGAGDTVSSLPVWLGRLPAKIVAYVARIWETVGSWDLLSLAALALVARGAGDHQHLGLAHDPDPGGRRVLRFAPTPAASGSIGKVSWKWSPSWRCSIW